MLLICTVQHSKVTVQHICAVQHSKVTVQHFGTVQHFNLHCAVYLHCAAFQSDCAAYWHCAAFAQQVQYLRHQNVVSQCCGGSLDIALPEMFATLIRSLHELIAALISSCTNCFAILKIRELLVARRIDVLQYINPTIN